jgi:putative redox protein
MSGAPDADSGTTAATPPSGARRPQPAETAKPPAKKLPSRVHAVWRGEQRFEAGRPGGPTLLLDGTGATAQNPVDALCSALAGCTGIDVVEVLAKRRTPVERLEVEVVGERSDAVPRRIVGVQLVYMIEGAGIERDQAARAIDLAINKYCSVRDSLARDIEITWSMTLNGEPFTPGGD